MLIPPILPPQDDTATAADTTASTASEGQYQQQQQQQSVHECDISLLLSDTPMVRYLLSMGIDATSTYTGMGAPELYEPFFKEMEKKEAPTAVVVTSTTKSASQSAPVKKGSKGSVTSSPETPVIADSSLSSPWRAAVRYGNIDIVPFTRIVATIQLGIEILRMTPVSSSTSVVPAATTTVSNTSSTSAAAAVKASSSSRMMTSSGGVATASVESETATLSPSSPAVHDTTTTVERDVLSPTLYRQVLQLLSCFLDAAKVSSASVKGTLAAAEDDDAAVHVALTMLSRAIAVHAQATKPVFSKVPVPISLLQHVITKCAEMPAPAVPPTGVRVTVTAPSSCSRIRATACCYQLLHDVATSTQESWVIVAPSTPAQAPSLIAATPSAAIPGNTNARGSVSRSAPLTAPKANAAAAAAVAAASSTARKTVGRDSAPADHSKEAHVSSKKTGKPSAAAAAATVALELEIPASVWQHICRELLKSLRGLHSGSSTSTSSCPNGAAAADGAIISSSDEVASMHLSLLRAFVASMRVIITSDIDGVALTDMISPSAGIYHDTIMQATSNASSSSSSSSPVWAQKAALVAVEGAVRLLLLNSAAMSSATALIPALRILPLVESLRAVAAQWNCGAVSAFCTGAIEAAAVAVPTPRHENESASLVSQALLALLQSGDSTALSLVTSYIAAGALVDAAHWVAAYPFRSPALLTHLWSSQPPQNSDSTSPVPPSLHHLLSSRPNAAAAKTANDFRGCVALLLQRGCNPNSTPEGIHALARNRYVRYYQYGLGFEFR